LAIDERPAPDEMRRGTKVLFAQGKYVAQQVHGVTRSAGLRWHQGEITRVYKEGDVWKFDGKHTKSAADGKWCTGWFCKYGMKRA